MRRSRLLAAALLAAACAPALTPAPALADACRTSGPGTIIIKGYEIGQTAIPAEERDRLAAFAETARHRFEICVSASVDRTGSDAANKKVSTARARNVVDFLAQHGVDRSKISVSNVEKSEVTFFGLFREDRAAERRVIIAHD